MKVKTEPSMNVLFATLFFLECNISIPDLLRIFQYSCATFRHIRSSFRVLFVRWSLSKSSLFITCELGVLFLGGLQKILWVGLSSPDLLQRGVLVRMLK